MLSKCKTVPYITEGCKALVKRYQLLELFAASISEAVRNVLQHANVLYCPHCGTVRKMFYTKSRCALHGRCFMTNCRCFLSSSAYRWPGDNCAAVFYPWSFIHSWIVYVATGRRDNDVLTSYGSDNLLSPALWQLPNVHSVAVHSNFYYIADTARCSRSTRPTHSGTGDFMFLSLHRVAVPGGGYWLLLVGCIVFIVRLS